MMKVICVALLIAIVGGGLALSRYIMRDAPPMSERTYSYTNITPGPERVPCICGLVLALAVVAPFILGKADDIDKANRM